MAARFVMNRSPFSLMTVEVLIILFGFLGIKTHFTWVPRPLKFIHAILYADGCLDDSLEF